MNRNTNIAKRKPKNRQHKGRAVTIIVLVLVFLLVAGGVVVFLNREKIFGNTQENRVENTTAEEQKQEKEKTEEKETKKESEREAEKPSVAQYEGENANNYENLTGVVSYAGISEGNFIVRVAIDQALGNSGTCNFTLTHSSGAALKSSLATEAGPSSSFCAYNVPVGSVQSGKWSISVEVTGANKKGVISGEATI